MRPDSPPGSPSPVQQGVSTEAFPLTGAKEDGEDDGENAREVDQGEEVEGKCWKGMGPHFPVHAPPPSTL